MVDLHSNMELLLPDKYAYTKSYYDAFTFQYGATSTDMSPFSSNKYSRFTFQYGATSTKKKKRVLNGF